MVRRAGSHRVSDPELHRLWLESVQASQIAYRSIADRLTEKFKDLDDRTLRRKKRYSRSQRAAKRYRE